MFRAAVKSRRANMNTMRRLIWVGLLASVPALTQSVDDATELLRKVQSVSESTKTWRAEVVERSQLSGGGMNLQEEVRITIAVQAPFKMSRRNSGDDQTISVCDGNESFYSGDGHSYYRSKFEGTPNCDLPLTKFYNLEDNPTTASVVGRDHVRLADGDRECVLVRATWNHAPVNRVRTMCIDPVSAVILRDVTEGQDEKTGVHVVTTTTFTSYETNPTFEPGDFIFLVPPGAVEAKPPI
jgi:outer membrane lipoprotein-sorting protein